MINTVKEFKLWRAYFCYSPKGKSALDGMKRLQQGINEFPYGNLESSVLSTCFLAAKYSPDKVQIDSRRRIGGLQFSCAYLKVKGYLKRKSQNVGRNSLVLHLSTFFRFYTSDESTFDWVGKKLPKFGQDCPDLVAKFVNAVYSTDNICTESIARINHMSQKEGIRLAHWKLEG